MKFLLFLAISIHLAKASVDFESRDFLTFINAQLKIEYKNIDLLFNEINLENRPSINCKGENENTETITYALHGYMGSPYEMNYVLKNSMEKGDVIFNDLIFGYGGSTKIANTIKKEMYYRQVERNLNYIFAKFKKVNLVGFSTGGLLITKYLMEHPRAISKVSKLRLISPYYFPHYSFAPAFGKMASIFKDSLSVNWFYKLTSFPDVEVILLAPNNFLQEIPLKAALEIAKLANEVSSNPKMLNAISDVEVFLTKEDKVLNYDKTKEFIPKIFSNAKINTFEGNGYPHHLASPLVSKAADQILNSL